MARSGGMTGLFRAMLLHAVLDMGDQRVHAAPSMGWFALLSSPALVAGSGYDLVEPPMYGIEAVTGNAVASGYARVPMAMGVGTGTWSLARDSCATNTEDISWPEPTTRWGLVRCWAMVDKEFGGRLLLTGSLQEAITVEKGDTVVIPAGGLTVSLDSYDMEW